MHNRTRVRAAVRVSAGALMIVAIVSGAGAHAATGAIDVDGASSPSYFIDFRSRRGYLFGHTFVVLGRIDAQGGVVAHEYAGIYPLDGQRGLMLGSIVPVRASVRAVEEDFAEPPSDVYRLPLDAAEYRRAKRVLSSLKATTRRWHLLFANCNDFAIAVAKGLGIRTPQSWLLPKLFVSTMRTMNSRRASGHVTDRLAR